MFRALRRPVAIVATLGVILLVSPGVVAASDPAASQVSRASIGQGATAQPLAAVSSQGMTKVKPTGFELHGSGQKPPATDTTPAGHSSTVASGTTAALSAWVLLFAAALLGSFAYLVRRLRE